MILHTIQVEGWGCFSNSVEVGPLDERLNVLSGANGTGKSTLLKIMTRGLMDTYSVGGAEAQSLRPWGRGLTPKVTIEFSHGGLEYRLRKRFLDKPVALLERHDTAGWSRIAEDEAADRHIRELLRAEAPGAGLSSTKHWGILQVLWSPQDSSAAPPLSGNVLADIHAALGVQISGQEGLQLQRRVENLYLQTYTPTGRLRSGASEPPVARLRREKIGTEEMVTRSRQELGKLESGRECVAELHIRYEEFRSSAERLAAELKQARAQLTTYQGLVSEKAVREQGKRAAEAEYLRIKQQLDAIRECAEAAVNAEQDLRAIEGELPRASELVTSGEQAHSTAAANLEKALENQGKAWDLAQQAASARQFLDLQDALKNLGGQIEGAELASLEIDRCRTAMGAVRAPSQKQLVEIRSAVRGRDEALVRLESSLIALEVKPVGDASIRVISGDQTGEQAVPGGSSARISGSPTVEIEIVGFGRIRAIGPAGSTAEYRRHLEQAAREVVGLTAPFGIANLGELEELWAEATDLQRNLQSAQSQLDAYVLGKSIADLRAEREQIENQLGEITHQQPPWATELPDVTAIEVAARRFQKDSESELRAAQEAFGVAQGVLNDARIHRTGLNASRERRRAEIDDFNRRLGELRSDGKTDVLRHQELAQASLEWDAQKNVVENLKQALTAYAPDPAGFVSSLERRVDQAARERDQARDGLRDEEARVRQLSSGAPYSALTEVEEKLEAISANCSDEEVRTEAVQLLHETVEACHSEAVASIPERVAETASSILHRIAGTSFRTVCLSESLAPTTVSPMSAGSPVPLADLSGGEKEQISFAIRLALAKELARSERQTLVLDDSLTTTDPDRFGRILDILKESAEQLQILILTCDPKRYEGLSGARLHQFERTIKEPDIACAA
jgi:DNA repair exonuclease SbcCD ATPase subunit